jgi:hypothetical protein
MKSASASLQSAFEVMAKELHDQHLALALAAEVKVLGETLWSHRLPQQPQHLGFVLELRGALRQVLEFHCDLLLGLRMDGAVDFAEATGSKCLPRSRAPTWECHPA